MKKKIFSIIFALLFCLPCFALLSACGKNNGDNNNKQIGIDKLELSYIKNLKMDMSGKQGLSIKKVNCDTNRINTISTNALLTFSNIEYVAENETTEKYMLFTTTQSYESGNVVYNKNSIEKVTFTKNESITEDVYNSNGNLISSNTELTQEEIPGQVNRLYVSGNYTFLQFVPLLASSDSYNYYDENGNLQSEYVEVRPNTLIYDVNGVAEFDKGNYYSSALSQSFVIDNNTGLIYKINNFTIEKIHDRDIVKDNSGNYYKIFINNQSELVFYDIMPNKQVAVQGVRTDKYGYTFVMNENSINEVDNDNKIIYTSNFAHMISNNAIMYTLVRNGSVLDLDKQYINGTLSDIDTSSEIYGLEPLWKNLSSQFPEFYYKGFNIHGFYPANGFTDMNGNLHIAWDNSYMQQFPQWLVGNAHFIYFIYQNQIYFKNIVLEDYFTSQTVLDINDFSLVSDKNLYGDSNYYINVGENQVKVDKVFYETTINGTNYYQLIEKDGGLELRLLENKEYTQNVFIFQPINK